MTQNNILLGLSILALLLSVSFSQPENKAKINLTIEEVSYETHIKPIMENYCTSCHSGEYPEGGLWLETYEQVRLKTERGNLLQRINDEQYPMPIDGLMPEKERKLIEEWANQGFLEKSSQSVVNNSQTAENRGEFIPPTIQAIDIDTEGFEFFEKMQGHWVGKMNLMGQDMPWFAFDYRAISPSHIHGIFEGGSMGNLFTAFFIANFKGTKTIMVRNGGVLNGLYRSSYFVLDKVENSEGESYYRFIDAYGGKDLMWIELRFKGNNQLEFNSYVSRMGSIPKPKPHMIFTAQKMNTELSKKAQKALNFPQNVIEKDFSKGLPKAVWEEGQVVKSASYFWRDISLSLEKMAKLSGDPYRIDEIPYVSSLKVNINKKNHHDNIHIFFSKKPLTDKKGKLLLEYDYLKEDTMNGVLLFSEIKRAKDFTFTYLHPGEYYITAFIDKNKDYVPSKGDVSNMSQKIVIRPSSKQIINLNLVTIQN